MSVIDIIKIAEVSDAGGGLFGVLRQTLIDDYIGVVVFNVQITSCLVQILAKNCNRTNIQVDHTYTLKYRLILEW